MQRTVKKLYDDCIELIDHEVRKCVELNEDYEVIYQGKKMYLTPEQLKNECVAKKAISKPVNGGTPYRLLAYKWKPKKEKDDKPNSD